MAYKVTSGKNKPTKEVKKKECYRHVWGGEEVAALQKNKKHSNQYTYIVI